MNRPLQERVGPWPVELAEASRPGRTGYGAQAKLNPEFEPPRPARDLAGELA
jgi:hypothetical protein